MSSASWYWPTSGWASSAAATRARPPRTAASTASSSYADMCATSPRSSGGTGDVQVVNVRNNGTFDFLGDDAVIEVPAVVDADGPFPVAAAPLPPLLRGLVAHMSAYEELAVDAALHGGRARVVAALLAHPLVGQYPLAEDMADRLIAENAEFLSWT